MSNIHYAILINFSIASTLVYSTLEPISSIIVLILFQTLVLGLKEKYLYFSYLIGALIAITITNFVDRTERKGDVIKLFGMSYIYAFFATYCLHFFLKMYESERLFPAFCILFDLAYFYDDEGSSFFIFVKAISMTLMQFASWYFRYDKSDNVLVSILLLSCLPGVLVAMINVVQYYCKKRKPTKTKTNTINKTDTKVDEKPIKQE